MKELITVIVPVYNVEAYLHRCVKSILAQTYPYLQIILVDDGSTDASSAICNSFAKQDSRVQVVHKVNGGPISARKAGLAKAEGEYVGFVDGDDYIEPNMYEELYNYLIETDSDFVQAGVIAELETGKSIICLPQEENAFAQFDKCRVISDYLLQCGEGYDGFIMASLCLKLYKRQMITKSCEKVPDEAIFGEDSLSVCHCLFASKSFAIKKNAYYHYSVCRDSLSCRNGDSIIFTRIGMFHRYLRDTFQQYGCLEQLRERQDEYLIKLILEYLVPLGKARGLVSVPSYYYPSTEKLSGKRIVIYGAGYVGQDYYAQLDKHTDCKIVALADTYPEKCHLEHIDAQVRGLKDLSTIEFDIVLISVQDWKVMSEIKDSLLASGIPEHKIKWQKPEYAVQ